MSLRFLRPIAMLLSLITFFQILPSGVIAEIGGIFSINDTESVSDFENDVSVDEIDFSTKRLLVGTADMSIFPDDANIIAKYGDVYLLGFEDESEAMDAYSHYSETADFVDADIALFIADNDFITDEQVENASTESDPQIPLEEGELESGYDIAIIDTGVANDATASFSVIGGDGVDDNGHGTAMLDAVKGVSDTVSVLSIKAFDSRGVGYLSDVYAAVMYAIEQDVSVISMSFAAERKTGGAALHHIVTIARDAGIAVVGAAGNDDADASDYIPGCLSDMYVVGACDNDGVKLPTSNYGKNILCNVVSASSSEAAAKLAAVIAVYGEDYVDAEMNNGLIFERNYGRQADEIVPDMLIVNADDDGDTVYEEYFNMAETAPSDKSAFTKLNTAAVSATAIDDDTNGSEYNEEDKYPKEGLYQDLPGVDPDVDYNVPPTQEPTTQDNTTIERIYVRWLSSGDNSSSPAYFGLLDLDPATDDVRNQQFQIDFALSGQEPYAPGMVRLEFPAYLWHDRDGNEPGELTLAIPEDPDNGAEFVWTREGDKIVVTNAKTIAAASKVMIQGTFRGVVAHEMIDNWLSDPFNVTLSVVTPQNNTISKKSNTIYAHIDTEVVVASAGKTAYNSTSRRYDVWWDSIPEGIPAELLGILTEDTKNDYAYIRWYVSGSAQGNQPFDMYVYDAVPENNEYGAIMLGVSDALKTTANPDGVYPSEDGVSVEALLFSGYNTEAKTAYVWTAYPKDKFPLDKVVELQNTQTIFVVGQDDNIETQKSADAVVQTKIPTTYTFIKYWDDDDNKYEMRPGRMYLEIYRDGYSQSYYWKRIELTEKDSTDGPEITENRNHWTYTWSDEGQADSFKVKEQLVNASGIYDERFDGTGHKLEWQYHLTDTKYDEASHTWTYTNSYDDGWIKFELSEMQKDVEYKFKDTATISSRDGQSLNKLQRGENVLVKYPVSSKISVAEQSKWYNIKPNLFALEDVNYIFQNNTDLTVDDVDIGAVLLNTPVLWRYVGEYDENGWYKRAKVAQNEVPTATLYGLIGEEWLPMADFKNGMVTDYYNDAEPNNTETNRVDLPKGVSRIKFQLVSDVEVVELSYTVYLRVYPTPSVLDMLDKGFLNSDYLRFTLYNKANAYAEYYGDEDEVHDERKTYKKGDRIVNLEDIATGYLHGRQFRVATDLRKTFKKTDNDASKRRSRLTSTLTLTQQSNVLTRSEYDEAIENGEIPNTRTGTYYDLLPYGVDPDLSSIKAGGNDSIINSYIIQDYRGTGRTMLVVMVNLVDNISYTYNRPNYAQGASTYPSEGFKNSHTLTFDSYISWDTIMNANINFAELYNVAAYEASESEIGSIDDWMGEPDNPAFGNHIQSPDAVKTDSDLMTGLDPERGNDDPAFVYAGAEIDTDEIDVSALTGLHKFVQVAGSGVWSKGEKNDVNVQEGGAYTYRLLVTSGTDTITKDIILLDSVEFYQPTDTDVDTSMDYQPWRGSLVSIDLAEVKALGIEPVVYYSTVPDLDLSKEVYNNANPPLPGEVLKNLETFEKDGKPIWSKEPPDDMSKVTAIAIDLTTMTDGEEFRLDPLESVSVYLHMRAPFDKDDEHPYYFKDVDGNDTDGTDHMKNSHAYNGVYLDSTQTVLGKDEHSYIYTNYTKVGIYTKDVEVLKVWDDADDADAKRPTSITVRLLANGEDTDYDPLVLNEENGWTGKFERLLTYDDDGNYIVYSYAESVDDEEYRYDFDEEYDMTVSREVSDDGSIHITLTNTHEPEKINIPVTKTWLDDDYNINNTRPAYIIVRLFANGVPTDKTLTLRPDTDWYGEFTDLIKNCKGVEIIYEIVEDPVDDYVQTDGSINDESGVYEITNTYRPFGDLIVYKHLEDATELATQYNEFTFWLKLQTTDEEGKLVDVINKYDYVVYDADGFPTDRKGKIGNGDSFTLYGGEYIVISDIDTHVKYTVTEENMRSFSLTGTVNATGEIVSWLPAEAEFTNAYITKGGVDLKAQKRLTGRDLLRYQFRFEVVDADGNVLRSAYNEADGTVSFGQIGYTNADLGNTYTYTIRERYAQSPGYIYDTNVYTVEVTPVDNGDGTITCVVVYYNADGTPMGDNETPVFKNEYHAEGSLNFRAWKVLDGYDMQGGDFVFDLYRYNEETNSFVHVGSAANNADSVINFTELEYNENDSGNTYWYFAREQKGDDAKVVYKNTVIGYKVTVVDNGNGTLSFNQTAYDVTDAFDKCMTCEGTGNVVTCEACDGIGALTTTETNPETGAETETTTPCTTCNGKGKVYCDTCGGYGYIFAVTDKVEIDCADCDGNGTLENGDDCATCQGSGKLSVFKWEEPRESIVPVFTNGLENGSFSVTKYIEGGDPNQEFRFKVKLTGPNVDELEGGNFIISEAEDRDFPTLDNGTDTDESEAAAVSVNGTEGGYAVWALMDDEDIEIKDSGVSGEEGDSVTWVIDQNDKLWIYPTPENADPSTGMLDNFNINGPSSTPWGEYKRSIKEIEIKPGVRLNRINRYLFSGLASCTSIIGLGNLDASKAENLTNFFSESPYLATIDLTGLTDLSSVTDIGGMFYACTRLTRIIGLENLKTGKALTSTAGMFRSCGNLTEINLWKMEFASGTNISMANMFHSSGVMRINGLEDVDVSNVTNMSEMFRECKRLPKLDLSGWDVRKVRDMSYMFYSCGVLTELNLDGWDTAGLTTMSYMFQDCSQLKELDLSSFNLEKVEYVNWAFYGCSSLTKLDMGTSVTSGLHNMDEMFRSCSSLTELHLGGFDTSTLWGMYTTNMFVGAGRISKITLGKNWYASNDTSNRNHLAAFGSSPKWVKEEEIAWFEPNTYTALELCEGLLAGNIEPGTFVRYYPSYTVEFDNNGASGAMDSIVSRIDQAFTTPQSLFKMVGSRLIGWQDNKYEYNEEAPDHYYPLNANDTATIAAGTYEAGDVVTLIPVWEEIDTSYTIIDGEFEFTLRGGEKATFKDIPAGTIYQVWEETEEGWVLIAQEGTSGVIEPLEEAKAAFFNLYQPKMTAANIFGTKTLDGNLAGQDANGAAFMFELVEIITDEDGTIVEKSIETVPATDSGVIQFSALIYEEVGTHEYIVREVSYTNPDIEYDKNEKKVTVTVTQDTSGNLISQVEYDETGLSFANLTKPGSLEISKKADGLTNQNKDTEFTFRVKLYNANGAPINEGAYAWYVKDSSTGNVVENTSTASIMSFALQQIVDAAMDLADMESNEYPVMTLADTDVDIPRGVSGEVMWVVDSNNKLTLTPVNGETGMLDNISTTESVPWSAYRSSITAVEIKKGVQLNETARYLFYSFTSCKIINGLENLDTSRTKDLTGMFQGCNKLTEINVGDFDTSNVTNMSYLFYNCTALKKIIGLDSFDTKQVTTMAYMFYLCGALTELDLHSFNTGKVTTMMAMFRGLKLDKLDLSSFNTSNVKNMDEMFWGFGCSELNLSSFNTGNISGSATNMFYSHSITKLILGPTSLLKISLGQLQDRVPYAITTRKWIREEEQFADDPEAFTSEQLRNQSGSFIWQYTKYTINFEPDEGTFGSMASDTANPARDYTIPPTGFAKLGYEQIGWYDAENNKTFTFGSNTGTATIRGTQYSGRTYESGDVVTLTPLWQESGHPGEVPYYIRCYQQSVNDSDSYTLAETLRAGYAAPGTIVSPEPKAYAGFITPEAVTETVTDTAVLYVDYYYNRVHYTLHFDGNGAEIGSMEDIAMVGEVSQTLPNCEFIKTGAVFLGWNTQQNGKGETYSAGTSVKNLADDGVTFTLYAQWLTLDNVVTPTDGEIIVTCKAGQTIVIPDLPAGTTYEIEEIYVPYAWEVSNEVGVEGTVYSNTVASSSIENTYAPSGVVSITAHKSLVGDTLTSGEFNFVLMAADTRYSHTSNIRDSGAQNGVYGNNLRQRDVVTIKGAKSLSVEVTVQTEANRDWLHIWEGNYTGSFTNSATGAKASLSTSTKSTYTYTIAGDTVTFGFYSDVSVAYYGYYAIVTATFEDGTPVYGTTVNGPIDNVEGSTGDDGYESNDWYGWAPVLFDDIKFTEPGTYYYTIREVAGDDPSIIYDDHAENIKIVVTDNGDGTLNCEVVYSDEHDGAPFVNTMRTGDLTVTKTLENATGVVAGKLFEFQIELWDSADNPLNGEYDVVIYDCDDEERTLTLTVTDGIAEPTVAIRGDESFTVCGLPHGAKYTVTETEEEGFEQIGVIDETGTIIAAETSNAIFTNRYTATDELPLSAQKIFKGGTLENGMFSFELIDELTGAVLQTVTAGANGNVDFAPLEFTPDDVGVTHRYRIREITEAPIGGVLYDTHYAIIVVDVTNDEDGTIHLDVTADVDDLVFTNTALFDLDISKTVYGDDDNDEDFSFILTLQNAEYDLSEVKYTYNNSTDLLINRKSTDGDNEWYEFTLKHGENITLLDLPYGTEYTVSEITDGYITNVVTTVSGKQTTIGGKETDGTMEADVSVEYVNNKFLMIPGSGGIGTLPFYLSGAVLVMISAWMYFRKWRRDRAFSKR